MRWYASARLAVNHRRQPCHSAARGEARGGKRGVAALNRTVQYFQQLDSAFGALADPTRCWILERLGRSDAAISELAEGFHMTPTGMKKHVQVLEAARLVTTEKVGRVRRCRFGPRRLDHETAWIAAYRPMLEARLNRLGEFLERTRGEVMTTTVNQEHAVRATVTTPTDREIRIERIFNASRDRVWQAFTDPELVAQWWGRGNKVVIERMEVKRGGHWRFVEHSAHGVHGFEGRYREVTPPERVVQTFEWDGMPGHVVVETVMLEDLGDGRTRIVNTSLFHTTEERDGMLQSGMENGLNESYAALDKLLATLR